jgi:hypothetical protein
MMLLICRVIIVQIYNSGAPGPEQHCVTAHLDAHQMMRS